ncbi:pentapeptide repeat protein [Methanocorpusculum labreanum Z]|uniref:Pentapeptide repeat protein n=1 Tax=Methanocorpusculum labreanum (strain ATCC 43576 / DSM 4855 / Z) TaxID=410358 RepID=A2SUA3_METLZ|nr:pentapeptide repeat protein [Methanocorpusculum labreanum Z]
MIECAQYRRIEEWNLAYEKYLKSEWERILPDEGYNLENIGKLFYYGSGFVRPGFQCKDFTNAIQEGADFSSAHLYGADFSSAHLYGADFTYASLYEADFICSHLEDTNLFETILYGANLSWASLIGADFICSHLERAIFHFSIVNGETQFTNSTIDDKTDFTGTSLSSARIEPELRTKLERNIRQIRWEEWYNDNKLLEIPARIFWKISDYGSSTRAILFTFLFSNVIFMMFYLALRDAGLLEGSILSSGNDLLLAYMQTTLVPFGILGIDLTTLSLFPVFIIFLQVIFGYTILAALVTRMAIMFQNLSP